MTNEKIDSIVIDAKNIQLQLEDGKSIQCAVEHLKLLEYLTDRPCSACKWRHHDGCMQFECPFDEVLKGEVKADDRE